MDKDQLIKEFRKKAIHHKLPYLIKQCTDKIVLDVGCIGQDFDPGDPEWLHGNIKKSAAQLVGIDPNTKYFNELQELGFQLYSPDSITEVSIPEPDIILMSDVIEHISDILAFLLFYKKFSSEKTIFLISTPNPYSIRQSFSILLFGRPGINPEHTVAIDPTNILEILSRAGFEVQDFTWLHEYSRPKKLYNRILFLVYRVLYSCRKFWAPNYLIVGKPVEK